MLSRYFRGKRALVLLPTTPDLSIEILLRSGRANRLFIGNPVMDSYLPSVWMPVITRQLARLQPGERLLMDRTGEAIATELAAHPSIDPIAHPIHGGASQVEWILRQIAERFKLRPMYEDQTGFVVAELESRAG